jgi:hypothetical protein
MERADWHVGESVPDILSRIVNFQADGHELEMILQAMRATRGGGGDQPARPISEVRAAIKRLGAKILETSPLHSFAIYCASGDDYAIGVYETAGSACDSPILSALKWVCGEEEEFAELLRNLREEDVTKKPEER